MKIYTCENVNNHHSQYDSIDTEWVKYSDAQAKINELENWKSEQIEEAVANINALELIAGSDQLIGSSIRQNAINNFNEKVELVERLLKGISDFREAYAQGVLCVHNAERAFRLLVADIPDQSLAKIEWISVDVDMPEKDRNVLLQFNNNEDICTGYLCLIYNIFIPDHLALRDRSKFVVTHWKKLPPEAKND